MIHDDIKNVVFTLGDLAKSGL